MSDLRSAAQRFLERTEYVRVRIPFDTDAAAAYEKAVADRDRLVLQHEKEASRRKLGEKPAATDLADADKAVEDADHELDRNSIVVVLRWRDGVYAEAMRWANKNDAIVYEANLRIAEGFFERVEELVGDEWQATDMTWEQFAASATDGEKNVVGRAAMELCTVSDAAPFRKPSRNSAAT